MLKTTIKSLLLGLYLTVVLCSRAAAAISIDGVLDEPEWAQAQVYKDFVTVEPLTGEAAKYSTQARLFTNAEGVFIGFTNYQPATIKRVNRQFPRDAEIKADRNVVSIDFDGTALAGYDFTVGSANSQQDGIVTPGDYSADWDGTWYSQTSSEGDYWYSEIHIPWTVAPMTSSDNGLKNIGLWFSRVVFDESLRFAFPNAYFSRTTFMEDWQPLQVEQVTSSTMDWFPYISYSTDLYDGAASASGVGNDFNGGLDFVWRPNSSSQLTGAINPDFGQVESDDLVVNFSAVETFVTEKRPFFTENQSLFSANIPNGDQALYTRRIGAGPADYGTSLVDIDMAAKLTYFGEAIDLGLFAVTEDSADGSLGGDFLSSRVQHKVGSLTLGHRLTYAERPALGREASVQVADMIWQKSDTTEIRGQILHSDISQQANSINGQTSISNQDFAGWVNWSYAPNDKWYHILYLSHYGDNFDMNDMGYMQRNNFREVFGSTRYDRLQFADSSPFLSSSTVVEYGSTETTDGDRLSLWAELDHSWTFRSTRKLALEGGAAAPGWDDQITRGNGMLAGSARYWLETRYSSPRGNDFTYSIRVNLEYSDTEKLALDMNFKPQLYLSETLTLGGKFRYKKLQEWLIWDFATGQLAAYDADHFNMDIRFDWYPSARQEVRLKFQWVGIDAAQMSSYELSNTGRLLPSQIQAADFSLSDTALQLRYRYQLAPLSDIFLVYSRGGYFDTDQADRGPRDLLQQGWDGLQVESVIAKIRYRF
jgi:hypothetical protein